MKKILIILLFILSVSGYSQSNFKLYCINYPDTCISSDILNFKDYDKDTLFIFFSGNKILNNLDKYFYNNNMPRLFYLPDKITQDIKLSECIYETMTSYYTHFDRGVFKFYKVQDRNRGSIYYEVKKLTDKFYYLMIW